MKKLFLTSQFWKVADELPQLLDGSCEGMKVAFIPTAADVYEEKPWMERDREKLVEMGFEVTDVNVKDRNIEELQAELEDTDVIFVAGGNTFYLLMHARESGFLELATELVEQGVVYVGSSAGSYIACPTIEVAGWKHQDRNQVGLEDLTALNFVPFLVTAHYKPEYDDSLKTGLATTNRELKILTNEQAIIVDGEDVRLVGSGPETQLS